MKKLLWFGVPFDTKAETSAFCTFACKEWKNLFMARGGVGCHTFTPALG